MKLGIRSEILNLDSEGLRRLAGEKILFRGMGYVSQVHDIRVSGAGGLEARVSGTREYYTEVEVDDDGLVYGYCSCPCEWEFCKHVVALILAAQEKVSNGEYSGLTATGPGQLALSEILEKKSREELIACILGLVKKNPGLEKSIIEIEQLRAGETQPLVHSLFDRIDQLSADDYNEDYWDDEDSSLDLAFITQKFQHLLASGHADEVVELGTRLWKQCNLIQEGIYDDGEFSLEILNCMTTVFEAVSVSSLPRPEQLLYLIDIVLSDEYSVFYSMQGIFDPEQFAKEDWLAVVETLQQRLKEAKGKRIFTAMGVCLRSDTVKMLTSACLRCGLQDKAIRLLEREVKTLYCYEELAELLITAGRLEEARFWCVAGYDSGEGNGAGGSLSLLEKLREIAVSEGRDELAAAYSAEKFFCKPLPSGYLELRDATRETGAWPDIRLSVLEFLNSGKRPYKPGWPLPPVEISSFRQPPKRNVPRTDLLVDIAILEERFGDAIELYRGAKAGYARWQMGLEVAEAVAATHPDFALNIWQKQAMSEIAQVKPSAYERAAIFLRKMHGVYQDRNDLQSWSELLAGIRAEHKRKRRLMSELDLLPDAGRR